MPATFEPIASQTLGSDTSVVEFLNVPGTFTDLILVCHASTATGAQGIDIRFNSDSGTNYSQTYLLGGSSVSSGRQSSISSGISTNPAGYLSTDLSPAIVHIFSYANTNVNKTVLGAASRAADIVARNVCLWRSTAAITSLALRSSSGDIKSGSTFSLYGIKAA